VQCALCCGRKAGPRTYGRGLRLIRLFLLAASTFAFLRTGKPWIKARTRKES
jgi:hypothetical protein